LPYLVLFGAVLCQLVQNFLFVDVALEALPEFAKPDFRSMSPMQQLELLQQQFARSSKMPSFPNVFACLQQLQQLQRLLEGGLCNFRLPVWEG
jgi:hypothetical protein